MNDPEGSSPSGIIAEAAASVMPSDVAISHDWFERVAKMEAALEQVELSAKYQTELANYVADLRTEAANIQTARRVVGIAALIAAALLSAAPFWVVAKQYPWFLTLPSYIAASLIIGSFAATVLLISTLARSVFRSAHERQADEFVPPQVKLIHELMNGLKG